MQRTITDQQILPYIDPNYTVTPVDFSLYAVQDAAFYRTFETGQHCYGCYIAGTEIHVIGVTSNGYWQVEDDTTGNTYYVAGPDLIASKEEALATYVPTVLEVTRAQYKEIYGNGEELSFTNTYTLPNTGITMPCLTGFNTVGLNPYGEWFSDSPMSDIYANHTATFMAGAEQAKMAWDRLEWRSMCYAYPGFFKNGNTYNWSSTGSGMLWGGIYIEKPLPGENTGYYKLVIRTPLDMANVSVQATRWTRRMS